MYQSFTFLSALILHTELIDLYIYASNHHPISSAVEPFHEVEKRDRDRLLTRLGFDYPSCLHSSDLKPQLLIDRSFFLPNLPAHLIFSRLCTRQ